MTRAELTKIDLQELKRLAAHAIKGPYTLDHDDQDYHALHSMKGYEWLCNIEHFGQARFFKQCSPEVIKALVDVVEKAREYINAHDNVVEAKAHARLRAALTPFTESTNEEA